MSAPNDGNRRQRGAPNRHFAAAATSQGRSLHRPGRQSLDWHATYIVATFVAGASR